MSLTVFPVILVSSGSGAASTANPPASGAGPATAVGGTKARTRNAASQSQIGFFESSAPDLSGISTDGSHVLFVETASGRRFSRIDTKKDTQQSVTGDMTNGDATLSNTDTTGWTAGDVVKVAGAAAAGADLYTTVASVTDGTNAELSDTAGSNVTGAAVVNPKQVKVENASFQITSDIDWAIGGKLASVWADTGYTQLVDDGSSTGDAAPGWTIEFQSAHAESSANTAVRCAGDSTIGRITIRGASGAATRPLITTTNGTLGLILRAGGLDFSDFDIRNTTSSAAYVIRAFAGNYHSFRRLKVYSTGATKATTGITTISKNTVEGCEIYDVKTGVSGAEINTQNNYIHDCSTQGILDSSVVPQLIANNLIVDCDIGITTASASRLPTIFNNIIDTCTTGIKISDDQNVSTGGNCVCQNNVIVNCTTGLHFDNAAWTPAWASYYASMQFRNNCYWNNTTHIAFNSTAATPGDDFDGDYVASAEPFTVATKSARKSAGNWTLNVAEVAKGFPTANVGFTAATRSYVDPGVQRIGTASGLGLTAANLRTNTVVDDVVGSLVVPGAASGSGTLAKDAGGRVSGNCAKLTPSSTSTYMYWDFFVYVSGNECKLSFYYKSFKDGASSFNGTVKVSWWDSDDPAESPPPLLNGTDISGTYDETDWYQWESAAKTPAAEGLCRVRIEVVDGSNSGGVYIDDIAVTDT